MLDKIMQEKEWPLRSKLDSGIYGPQESAITNEIIEEEIKGFMTVDEVGRNPFSTRNKNHHYDQ